ncbi:hypothetical protein L1049_022707 [Liquidambar formosana]|uniref:F-box domain-containing protein n=1 Tax=Liquidambar formosana TaxID=63359 RepID=A0AAP0RCV3_LIQFO
MGEEACINHQQPPRIGMDKLPLDVVFNIFSRLPIKSLLRSRCVSKHWRNIIEDPFLANLHLSRAVQEHTILALDHPTHRRKVTSLYLVKEDGNKNLKASKNPIAELSNSNNYSLEGSCNGLLYFAKPNERDGVILLNPLTGQNIMLPPATIPSPCPHMKKYGLGFDPSTNTYKIVRVFFRNQLDWKNYSLGVEVHTLGTNSWREIGEIPPSPMCGRPVSAYGALHWMVDPPFACDNLKSMIVSFDIGKEVFSLTPHPDFGSKTCDMFQLVDFRGFLAMADLSSDSCILIWVLKDYDKKEWVEEFRIQIRPPMGRADNCSYNVVGPWKNGEILLSSSEGYFCYNSKTDNLRYIHTGGPFTDTTTSEVSIYSHRGSLVSCSSFKQIDS